MLLPFPRLKQEFLQQVILHISRSYLLVDIRIDHIAVISVRGDLHVAVAHNIGIVLWQERVPVVTAFQVAEMAIGQRRERSKFLRTVVEVEMRGSLVVYRAITQYGISSHNIGVFSAQHWILGTEHNRTAQSI